MISTSITVVGDVRLDVNVRRRRDDDSYVSIKIDRDTYISLDLAMGVALRDALDDAFAAHREALAAPAGQDTEATA